MTSSCAGMGPLFAPWPKAARPTSRVLLISAIQAGSAGSFLCLQTATHRLHQLLPGPA